MSLSLPDSGFVSKVFEEADIAHQVLLRAKSVKCYIPETFQYKKVFSPAKTENPGKFKLYYEHVASPAYNGTSYNLYYLIRADEPKLIMYNKKRFYFLENSEILYYIESLSARDYTTNKMKTTVDVNYINTDCPNLITLFSKSNKTLKEALDSLGTITYIKQNSNLLPDWAKDYHLLK